MECLWSQSSTGRPSTQLQWILVRIATNKPSQTVIWDANEKKTKQWNLKSSWRHIRSPNTKVLVVLITVYLPAFFLENLRIVSFMFREQRAKMLLILHITRSWEPHVVKCNPCKERDFILFILGSPKSDHKSMLYMDLKAFISCINGFLDLKIKMIQSIPNFSSGRIRNSNRKWDIFLKLHSN